MSISIAQIERAASRAWPARETVPYDGWLLRYGDGFSRRINSVAATESSTRPLDEKLDRCRRWYAERGLPLLFRITPAVEAGLEDGLDERGFAAEGRTIVVAQSVVPTGAQPSEVRIGESPSGRWIAAELELAGVDPVQAAGRLAVMKRLPDPAGFALLRSGDTPVAAGVGVVIGGWLGVFEVVVGADRRRRGHGRVLMEALHTWGAERGAQRSFLQVVVENRAAIGLYEGLGYEEAYRYWYRRERN